MAYVFAALLEYAIANYLNRQRSETASNRKKLILAIPRVSHPSHTGRYNNPRKNRLIFDILF